MNPPNRTSDASPLFEPLEPRLLLDGALEEQAIEMFSVSPALFVQNQGQWADASVRYVHNGSGANVAMTDTGPVFQVFREVTGEGADGTAEANLADPLHDRFEPDACDTLMLYFSATFVGANAVTPVGLERSEATFNYLLGDEENWRSDVPAYEMVAYEGLYDGIDLHTWGQRDSLKYEFHVAPGADYAQIQVTYEGIQGLSLAEDGSLLVDLGDGWGEVADDAPIIYQEIGAERVEVAGAFALIDSDTYTFEVTGPYDPARELVIDPDLAWATYLGGSDNDGGIGIAVDAAANTYVTGSAHSSGWATPGAYDTSHNGGPDVFVAKVDPSGSSLLWATYLGGSGDDLGTGIAVDTAGNSYVTGETHSSGWATPGAYDTSYDGAGDVFVAKVNPAGSSLLWATYLGGSGYDRSNGIAVDTAGNAYVTGMTDSSGWATPGAYDTSHNGGNDVFVAKVNPAGSSLLWATYLGGSDLERGYDIAVDTAGNAYVTGYTGSSGWATPGAYDTSYSGDWDGFVAKINPSGSNLVWATYLGGSGSDGGRGIAVDAAGNSYVTGSARSSGWATPGAYDTSHNGDNDVFVAKVNPSGSSLLWGTYLGGSGYDHGLGIGVDAAGNSYVTGYTASSGWATPGAYDTSHNGSADVFVAKVNPSGSSLLWATYLGGADLDIGFGIAADAAGNAYVTGFTHSSGWATPGAYDTSHDAVVGDAFVARIGQGVSLAWAGEMDDHWENGVNWPTGVTPGMTDTAVFENPATYQPVLYQDQGIGRIEFRTGGWTLSCNSHTLAIGEGGITFFGGAGAPTSTIDLGTGSLVRDYAAGASVFDEVSSWIACGCHGGAWDGQGITSSAAAGHPQGLTAVGVIDNSDPEPGIGGLAEFGGAAVDETSVLAACTWWGDVNLDGVVDSNDYDRIDTNYVRWINEGRVPDGGWRWAVGDLDYDNMIDSNDYDRIDNAFVHQAGPAAGGAATLAGRDPLPLAAAGDDAGVLMQSPEVALLAETYERQPAPRPADLVPALATVWAASDGPAGDAVAALTADSADLAAPAVWSPPASRPVAEADMAAIGGLLDPLALPALDMRL